MYIQTKLNNYTYRVTGKQTGAAHRHWPCSTRSRAIRASGPTQRLITLITCDPAWTGTHRVIVTGVLISATRR